MKICVKEIFYSIQGETTLSGFPSLFIRTAGCNLDCVHCDTAYAREGGEYCHIENVLDTVTRYPSAHHITVTGGEPLIQEGSFALITALTDKKYTVQLETNGSQPVVNVPGEVRKILDVKTPSSGEDRSFLMENLDHLGHNDEVKFIIADDRDYHFACRFIEKYLAKSPATVNFSPESSTMRPEKLAGKVLEDRLRVRLNLQLHRCIWGNHEPGTLA